MSLLPNCLNALYLGVGHKMLLKMKMKYNFKKSEFLQQILNFRIDVSLFGVLETLLNTLAPLNAKVFSLLLYYMF